MEIGYKKGTDFFGRRFGNTIKTGYHFDCLWKVVHNLIFEEKKCHIVCDRKWTYHQ